ncbi:replication-relaxation family protein [Antrihabitans stalactiti]|uniref:Replication-relaxation n=1 Tax=Antrihabitans stalactiti TaxID=2584121 RepID=A0A848KHE9_9NOCA|nr:replication-relaxation family protein [Antrihabitans stalactiti]NMN98453.1 hypothetical protein [Antrihabitans stalactiti]
MSARSRTGVGGLSERDVELLRLLSVLRLLNGGQLQRLLVSDGSPATRARRARSVLQRLYIRGLVGRLDRRVGGIRAGSDGFVYRLTSRGFTALAQIDGSPRRRVASEPGERFVAHVLAVSELYVGLVETTRDANETSLRLVSFDAEPACWRRYPAAHGGTSTIRPDAFVQTGDGERGYVHFIECDMATESLTTIRAKCRSYVSYWRSGSEQRRIGTFPRVLWVVPNTARAERIAGVIRHLPVEVRPLFAVTTAENSIGLLLGQSNEAPTLKGGES